VSNIKQEPFDPDIFLEEFEQEMKQKRINESQNVIERLEPIDLDTPSIDDLKAQRAAQVDDRLREYKKVRSNGVFLGILYTLFAGFCWLVLQAVLENYGYFCPTPTLTWHNLLAVITPRERETRMVHLDTLINAFEQQHHHEHCRILR
jgi:hypothetical protein